MDSNELTDFNIESSLAKTPIKTLHDSPYMKSVEEECEDAPKTIPQLTRTSSTPISSRETTPTENHKAFIHNTFRLKRFTPPLNRCFSITAYPSTSRQYGSSLSPLSFSYLMQATNKISNTNGTSNGQSSTSKSCTGTRTRTNILERCVSLDDSSHISHPDNIVFRDLKLSEVSMICASRLDVGNQISNNNFENNEGCEESDVQMSTQTQNIEPNEQYLSKTSDVLQSQSNCQSYSQNSNNYQQHHQEQILSQSKCPPTHQRPPISHHLPSQLPKPRLYTLSATTATATPSVHSMRRERYFSRRTISDQGPQHHAHLWGSTSSGLWNKRKDPKRTSAPSMTNAGNSYANGSTGSTNASSPSSTGSVTSGVKGSVFLKNRRSWPAQPIYRRRYVCILEYF